MASGSYMPTFEKVLNDFYEAGTWKAILLTSSYTENRDTHDFVDDVIANEVSGTGYTAGGQSCSTPTVAYNATTNEFTITFPQVVWTSSTITARACVYVKVIGSNATDHVVFVNKYSTDITSTNANFTTPACTQTIDFPDTD